MIWLHLIRPVCMLPDSNFESDMSPIHIAAAAQWQLYSACGSDCILHLWVCCCNQNRLPANPKLDDSMYL